MYDSVGYLDIYLSMLILTKCMVEVKLSYPFFFNFIVSIPTKLTRVCLESPKPVLNINEADDWFKASTLILKVDDIVQGCCFSSR